MKAILLGGGLALVFSLLGTRAAIPLFFKFGYGQPIRDDGPTSHHTKRGTPTMGGIVIIASTVLAYFLAELITQNSRTAIAVGSTIVESRMKERWSDAGATPRPSSRPSERARKPKTRAITV